MLPRPLRGTSPHCTSLRSLLHGSVHFLFLFLLNTFLKKHINNIRQTPPNTTETALLRMQRKVNSYRSLNGGVGSSRLAGRRPGTSLWNGPEQEQTTAMSPGVTGAGVTRWCSVGSKPTLILQKGCGRGGVNSKAISLVSWVLRDVRLISRAAGDSFVVQQTQKTHTHVGINQKKNHPETGC